MLHVYGGTPPVATKFPEYELATVPVGSGGVVAFSGAAALTVIVSGPVDVAVCTGIAESTTCGVNVHVTAVVGMPVICPAVVFRLSPGGKFPLSTLHVSGVTPPFELMPAEYVAFTVPFGSVVAVTESFGAGLMSREYCGDTTESGVVALSVTVSVNVAGFGCPLIGPVGTPTICPVELLICNPAGKLPLPGVIL